jgi:hypothetical protein
MQSFVSVFDITPSRHKSLHELLRTGDFLTKPLYPGIEGHANEVEDVESIGVKRNYTNSDVMTPLAWFQNGGGDKSLCRCRTIFDRGRESSPNLTRQERNFRAELRQFSSSTSTMFSAFAEQEVFDDLRKLHLLPQTTSHHPQVYSRFNQTSMLYRVGYGADVADLRIRFLTLQLFHAVHFCHSKGMTLGDNLRPDRIYIDDDGWLRLIIPIVQSNCGNKTHRAEYFPETDKDTFNQSTAPGNKSTESKSSRRFIFDRYKGESNPAHELSTDENISVVPYPGYGLVPFIQWQKGHITNLAYLMMVNAAAGR